MPIPKPETHDTLTVKGAPAKRLVQVAKPYKKDDPDIMDRLVALAAKAAAEKDG